MSLRGYRPVLQTQEEKDAQTARQFAEAAKSAEGFKQAAAEAVVFAGDRELQAAMRELDAALADMVEELPQQA
jgi:hypothetical protein